jgi:transposase
VAYSLAEKDAPGFNHNTIWELVGTDRIEWTVQNGSSGRIDRTTHPDHSIFSKARARYGKEAFEQFFAEIVRRCNHAGLIDGDRIFMDATLLKANASQSRW